mgnify:FL=1
MKTYKIGGITYQQRPLVIGQVKQLLTVLEGLTIPSDIDMMGLVATLGDRLPDALAVILTPDGMSPKDKDLKKLSEELAFSLEIEQAMEVVEDFFVLNPISSLFGRLNQAIEKIQAQFLMSSTTLSASSQEETSQKEMQSSGDIPSKNVSDISNTGQGK